MTKPCRCEATKRDGYACDLPAYAKQGDRWYCIVHLELAINQANKFRDLLYAPHEPKDQDQR